jgi:hypothetical protein
MSLLTEGNDIVSFLAAPSNARLRTVLFQTDSALRSIGRFAFPFSVLFESICIPSSVEVLRESCFFACSTLRTVTLGAESKLRLIERNAFDCRRSLKLVSVPASVEVIGPQPIISASGP